jgi:hypothetical protein
MTGDYIIEDTGNSGVDNNWRTDLDYDGVAWGQSSMPKFKWFNIRYDDLAAFQAASGQEAHAVEMPLSCFETLDVPGPPPAEIPPQHVTLAEGCNGVNAGEVLPNINDDYVGAAPDLGAHERGAPPLHYGPRDVVVCGDGRVEGNETCDPPATCPTGCDDSDPCTTDRLEGHPQSCTAQCWHDPIAACQDGGTQDGGTQDDDAQPQDGGNGVEGSGCGCGSRPGSALVALVLLLPGLGRFGRRQPVR